jgi:hypothetical protein
MNGLNSNDLTLSRALAKEKVDALAGKLQGRLGQRFGGSVRMEWGQIKGAARYTIKNLGHNWIMQDDGEDKHMRMWVRFEVKRLVKSTVGKWHKNPGEVWLQFKQYCLEMAVPMVSKELLKRFTVQK